MQGGGFKHSPCNFIVNFVVFFSITGAPVVQFHSSFNFCTEARKVIKPYYICIGTIAFVLQSCSNSVKSDKTINVRDVIKSH